jgi:hypothetical protein
MASAYDAPHNASCQALLLLLLLLLHQSKRAGPKHH